MGMVTIHLVVGVGVLILPLFLVFFSLSTVMSLATLYIMIGAISFVTSVVTTIILVTKFINQPAAHGFFSYSDTMASALLSLGLLLDGVIPFVPTIDIPCYQYALIYSLFIVPIITGFFSVLGMAIERFQAFAVYRDTSVVTRKFSIAWFLSSWTLAICFVVILVGQIEETGQQIPWNGENSKHILEQRKFVLASQIFPGPHSQIWYNELEEAIKVNELIIEGDTLASETNSSESVITESGNELTLKEDLDDQNNTSKLTTSNIVLVSNLKEDELFLDEGKQNKNRLEPEEEYGKANTELPEIYNARRNVEVRKFQYNASMDKAVIIESMEYKRNGGDSVEDLENAQNENESHPRCEVKSNKFIMYYFTLLFLLCFTTPVLITTSLNVYITSAVKNTQHDIIAHHQWLTLGACVLMWGPCLVERLLSKWGLLTDRLPVSVFLFLLGHTHNLLRCVLHAVFAQQMQSNTRNGISINVSPPRVSWGPDKQNKVKPFDQKSTQEDEKIETPPKEQKRKNTLTPRPPCIGMTTLMTTTPQPTRRATMPGIPNIQIIETTCT